MQLDEASFWNRAKVLYRHPSVELVFDEASGIFVTHWLGYSATSDHRNALVSALDIAGPLKPSAWIGDHREMRIVSPENQRWTTDEFWPRFRRLGHRSLATVVGRDLFNKLAVDRIMLKATPTSPWETQHFDSLEAALTWAAAT